MRGVPSLNDVVDVFSCCIFTWNALTVMVPVFVLAGAISVFIPPPVILRYFGAGAKKWVAYGVAAASGCVLAICSCNVVPLFMTVHRRGAGLGPAITFLYAGPAISLVSLVFTFKIIGLDIGLWRAATVPIMAVLVGLIMAAIFRKEEAVRQDAHATSPATMIDGHPARRLVPFFLTLSLMVLSGSFDQRQLAFMTWPVRIAVLTTLAGLAAIMAIQWFERDELKEWGLESWKLVRFTVPILLVSVLIIGYLAKITPLTAINRLGLIGTRAHSPQTALSVSAFGAFMYFPVLTEVAFAKAMLKMGGGIPPHLAFIVMLTGAGLSLPGQILILRSLGLKKLVIYVALLIVMAALAGMLFDHFIGQYICPCTENNVPTL